MLGVLITKELKRVFTDKRLVISTFIMPAIVIFVMYSLIGKMAGDFTSDISEHNKVIVTIDAPKSFENFINNNKDINKNVMQFNYQRNNGNINNLKEMVLKGNLEYLIVFPENFEKDIIEYDNGKIPNINTFYNPSEEYSLSANSNMKDIFNEYKKQLLEKRVGDENILKTFNINEDNTKHELAEEGKEFGNNMSLILPMLLNIFLFAGAMGIGIDLIAGEKERGTMAKQLLTPVSRNTIALSKVVSLAIISIISALFTILAVIASLPMMLNGTMMESAEIAGDGSAIESMGTMAYGMMDFLSLLILVVLQVLIFVGITCVISAFAKTVKEAGSYISPVYMIVTIASMTTMFGSGAPELIKYAIPIYGNVLAMKQLMMFELDKTGLLISIGVSIITIVILLKLIVIAFNSEKIA